MQKVHSFMYLLCAMGTSGGFLMIVGEKTVIVNYI